MRRKHFPYFEHFYMIDAVKKEKKKQKQLLWIMIIPFQY